jgi:hypothetical protein
MDGAMAVSISGRLTPPVSLTHDEELAERKTSAPTGIRRAAFKPAFKSKGKGHLITCHDVPEWRKAITLPFL